MRDMLGRKELIPIEQALELLLSSALTTPHEIKIPLEEANGFIVAHPISSPENLPHFRKSTVDGYAVHSSDTFGATDSLPACLDVKAEVFMGERPEFHIAQSEAAKIATGGMLPDDTDAVVMFEHTHRIDNMMIEVIKPVSPGAHVIQVGEDVQKGEPVLEKGRLLKPQDLGALAGLGLTHVSVFEKPRVSILATGDEMVTPDKPVTQGKIRDMNSYTLSGLIQNAGGIPIRKGILRDEYAIIKNAVKECLKDSQMILITGGSSVGTKDLTAQVMNDCGKPGVLFHGISMKPGKPTIGGVIETIPVFGLPGHPAAVVVCFKYIVEPVLNAISGFREDISKKTKRYIHARIAKNISSSPGRQEYIGVMLEERGREMWAIPLLGKSGIITTLTKADGMAVIPLNKLGVHKGEIVAVQLFS